MKKVQKSVLIWFSPHEMFSLVTDVASYSTFLPWCDQSRVLSSQPDGMMAEIGISFAGVHQTFITRNQHIADRQVRLELVKGPFSSLHGQWDFHPVGDGTQRACTVELELSYDFSNRALRMVVGPVFDKIASNLVNAFIQRAQQVYG